MSSRVINLHLCTTFQPAIVLHYSLPLHYRRTKSFILSLVPKYIESSKIFRGLHMKSSDVTGRPSKRAANSKLVARYLWSILFSGALNSFNQLPSVFLYLLIKNVEKQYLQENWLTLMLCWTIVVVFKLIYLHYLFS